LDEKLGGISSEKNTLENSEDILIDNSVDLSRSSLVNSIKVSNKSVIQLNNLGIEIITKDLLEKYCEMNNLDLSNNLISKIQCLNTMPHLKQFRINKNIIKTIENLEENINIEQIDISKNCIDSICLEKPLFSLRYLDLSYNPISEMFSETFFPNITSLTIDNCLFTTFSCINGFVNLKNLSISSNKLVDDVPLLITKLTTLDVSNNYISSLSVFKNLHKLEFLDISGNPINDSSFECGSLFSKMKEIKVTRTGIITPIGLSKICPNIEVLDVSMNSKLDVRSLPLIISDLKLLKSLDFRDSGMDCQICCPIKSDIEFKSLKDFEYECPGSFNDYFHIRKAILNNIKSRPFKLDNICVEELEEVYQGIRSPKKTANLSEDALKNEDFRPKLKYLYELLNTLNEKRKINGLASILCSIDDINRSEIDDMIKIFEKSISKEIKRTHRLESKKNALAKKILIKSEEMKAYLEGRSPCSIALDENSIITDECIDSLWKEYEALCRDFSNFKNNMSLHQKWIKIQKRIFDYGLSSSISANVDQDSRIFKDIKFWISLKMPKKFFIVSVLALKSKEKLTKMKRCNEIIQLVVSNPSFSSAVLSDHMFSFENEEQYEFYICGVVTGLIQVDYKNYSSFTEDCKKISKQYSSKVFMCNGRTFFLIREKKRLVPMFRITLRVGDS